MHTLSNPRLNSFKETSPIPSNHDLRVLQALNKVSHNKNIHSRKERTPQPINETFNPFLRTQEGGRSVDTIAKGLIRSRMASPPMLPRSLVNKESFSSYYQKECTMTSRGLKGILSGIENGKQIQKQPKVKTVFQGNKSKENTILKTCASSKSLSKEKKGPYYNVNVLQEVNREMKTHKPSYVKNTISNYYQTSSTEQDSFAADFNYKSRCSDINQQLRSIFKGGNGVDNLNESEADMTIPEEQIVIDSRKAEGIRYKLSRS